MQSIKQKFPGVTISSLLLFAFSKSLESFTHKRNLVEPKKVKIMQTFVESSNFLDSTLFRNRFATDISVVPIENYQVSNMRLPNFADTSYYIDSLVYFPIFMSNFFYKCVNPAVIFTNFPGPLGKIKFGNYEVRSIGGIVNNFMNTPIGLEVFSYNGKLQFSILSDAAAISNVDDLKEILDGMINELKLNFL